MEYGLIGARLSHSFSPQIHDRFGRYRYELLELRPEALGSFLAARSFRGLNVTIPYKQAVLPYLDWIDDAAAAIGAVNTVVNRNGKLCGYNTDFGGMEAMLSRAGIDLRGKKVLILGTGGTASTALAVARHLGAAEIQRVSRTAKPGAITYAEALRAHTDAEVLLNTTPVGMAPNTEQTPLDLTSFPRLEGLADVIYNPLRTRLCLAPFPRRSACKTANGLSMLVRQAALACELFTGQPIDPALEASVYRALIAQRENLVLIGMPGSGKSTVGRLLAQMTGKPFFDSDEELVRRARRAVSAIFAAEGEARFRALETELLQALSSKTGCVIATGGGAVLQPENVLRLKQNGRLFFLNRPPEVLVCSDDRPLADTAEKLRRLYEARYPVYSAAADTVIDNPATPKAAAEAILLAERSRL